MWVIASQQRKKHTPEASSAEIDNWFQELWLRVASYKATKAGELCAQWCLTDGIGGCNAASTSKLCRLAFSELCRTLDCEKRRACFNSYALFAKRLQARASCSARAATACKFPMRAAEHAGNLIGNGKRSLFCILPVWQIGASSRSSIRAETM